MTNTWRARSQAFLRFAVQELLDQLRTHQAGGVPGPYPLCLPSGAEGTAFEYVSERLGLDEFEQLVLLLAAADELQPLALRARCAQTFGWGEGRALQAYLSPFALLSWCQDADPGAFRSERALLHNGLVRLLPSVDATGGQSLRPLQIVPGAFEFLMGQSALDAALGIKEVRADTWLPRDAEQVLCEEVAQVLRSGWDAERSGGSLTPLIVNVYGDFSAAQRVAEASCAALGEALGWPACTLELDLALDGLSGAETRAWLTSWRREAQLKLPVLALSLKLPLAASGEDASRQGLSADALLAQLRGFLDAAWCPTVVVTRDPLALDVERPVVARFLAPASPGELRGLWAQLLGLPQHALTERERRLWFHLAGHFELPPEKLLRVMNDVLHAEQTASDRADEAPGAVSRHARRLEQAWSSCRRLGQAAMANVRPLAEHLTPNASWDDLVLPEAELDTLHDLVLHVQRRAEVEALYGDARGGAIVALFSGPSGTGKTFAAQVLARELQLDVYRVNLSNLTSKWLGETEKNLEKLFDAADEGGGVLLFDEADSVFGKRGDASDANGRYANMQTNYLLQRLEAYRGLAILTTNLPNSIDSAFFRRVRFEVPFREPEAPQRRRLWARAFPRALSLEGLDFERLAQHKLTGANIKSAARHAVYLATAQGGTLDQATVEQAVARELRKTGRFLTTVP